MSATKRMTGLNPPAATLAALRDWYGTAVARMAAELRPRFESGELREWREGDHEAYYNKGRGEPPFIRIENECRRRFVGELGQLAHLVLAVSPSTRKTYDSAQADPVFAADDAMALDVLEYARAQGWGPGRAA